MAQIPDEKNLCVAPFIEYFDENPTASNLN